MLSKSYKLMILNVKNYFLIIGALFFNRLCWKKFPKIYKMKHLSPSMKHIKSFSSIFLLDYSVFFRRMAGPTDLTLNQ